jgi:hypothetical protein
MHLAKLQTWTLWIALCCCQAKYNPRLERGVGLTFGDLPENLWADTRKYSKSMAYMGDAPREMMLGMVVRVTNALAPHAYFLRAA